MGIILLDTEKAGFARYCPTFARAFGILAEGIIRRRRKRELSSLVRDKKLDRVIDALKSERDRRIVCELVAHRDHSVGMGACWAFRKAAESGMDLTSAVPSLLKGLADRRHLYKRIDSAMALGAIAKSADPLARLEIADSMANHASEALVCPRDTDPGAATLQDALDIVLSGLSRMDGVHPIAIARLRRARGTLESAQEEARANP